MIIVALIVAGCGTTPAPESTDNTDKDNAYEAPAESSSATDSNVVFTITDAAADMGTVTEIKVTVDSIKVHSDAKGWVTVSDESKTFDLLELKAEQKQALLAEANLETGTYNQLRLDISKVVVVDDKGETEAKLPSGELKIQGELEVKDGTTSTASFDFIADESLHVTGNGKYIMAPVIQLETRNNAEVSVKSDNSVVIKDGEVKTNIKVGMDISGNVNANAKIPVDVELNVGSSGKIFLGKKLSVKTNSAVDTMVDAVIE